MFEKDNVSSASPSSEPCCRCYQPPVSSAPLVKVGSHTAQSSCTRNTDSFCHHKMGTEEQPSIVKRKVIVFYSEIIWITNIFYANIMFNFIISEWHSAEKRYIYEINIIFILIFCIHIISKICIPSVDRFFK